MENNSLTRNAVEPVRKRLQNPYSPVGADPLTLSIIVPFRADPERPYLSERLKFMCEHLERDPCVELVLVDSGSDPESRMKNERICMEHGVNYLYHDSFGDIFAIGAARDYGVQHANSTLVTFMDVDLVPTPGFGKAVIELASILGIDKDYRKFFVVPCLYLTEAGTEEFLATNSAIRHQIYFQGYLLGNEPRVQNLAPCSSVMVINRYHYLCVGGHRPEFKGHGYEDFELIHRLCVEEGMLPRAANYYKDSKNWANATYEGFRAQFALKGRHALFSGIYVAHLWHPRPPSSGYETRRFVNHATAEQYFKKFDKDKFHPEPLVDLTKAAGRTLLFGTPFTNATECIRGIAPYLGKLLYVNEHDFVENNVALDEAMFEKSLAYLGVTQLLFLNPYGSEARLAIYNWARRTQFPYLIFERGALPDSWFIDNKGFNADSASYTANNWDHALEEHEIWAVENYINNVLTGQDALENQGSRIGGRALASALRVGGKKVLFVPFQRPSDTVIKYFADGIGSVANFAERIDEAAKKLAKFGWLVLCKRHPLETETPELKFAQWVPEDTHFIDLLELADSVALINSGVGVYSLMMEKPTFIFGQAFYADPRLNKTVRESDDFAELVLNGSSVCRTTMLRFIYFLREEFYSYGKPQVSIRTEKDGSKRSITSKIELYRICIPNLVRIKLPRPERRPIGLTAPLLESYQHDILQRQQAAKTASTTKATGAASTTPTTIIAKAAAPSLHPLARKYRKLRRSPEAFFKDSRNPAVRLIGKLVA